MAVLYTGELSKFHYASWHSRAFWVTVFMVFTSFALPFLLVYRTHNFWVQESFYYEQPEVKSLNEVIIMLNTDKGTYSFGSTSQLNQILTTSDKSLAPNI